MVFEALLRDDGPAFALLHRHSHVEVLTGTADVVDRLADVPLPAPGAPGVLAIVPYRQIRDRGLEAVDDGDPLVALTVTTATTVPAAALPDAPGTALTGAFDLSDDAYADDVRRVVAECVGGGIGSNFVVRRTFRADVPGWSRRTALGVFGRLLRAEQGAYWTFLVHWNGRTLIGATPECQVRYANGRATMSPISGTYRHTGNGPDDRGLRAFLDDRKETEELFMVVDEELKMMSAICDRPPRLRGPWLRPMSRVTHTEYAVEGPTIRDPRDVLARTLPAPTVTGSPLGAACDVVARYERGGRGYYGGALAWFGWRDGARVLDSALTIRTADVTADGVLTLSVGATIVRHSDPAAEAAETRAKAAAVLAAFGPAPHLDRRNQGLSHFWRGHRPRLPAPPARRLLLVDAGDDFTAMLAALARSLGVDVTIRPATTPDDVLFDGLDPHDPVLLGPGPGDPLDVTVPRVARLHTIARNLLASRRPFLAVCLGHQVVASVLGLPVRRLAVPAQGVRRRIDWCGTPEWLGFYNTFAVTHHSDRWTSPVTGEPVRLFRDGDTVHALATARLRSVQFHLESVLTEHGPEILHRLLRDVTVSCPRTAVGSPAFSG